MKLVVGFLIGFVLCYFWLKPQNQRLAMENLLVYQACRGALWVEEKRSAPPFDM